MVVNPGDGAAEAVGSEENGHGAGSGVVSTGPGSPGRLLGPPPHHQYWPPSKLQ